MSEIWKDIRNYEGRYKVSDLGRIKSYVSRHNIYSELIMKPTQAHNGYMLIGLCDKLGKVKRFGVHRIVASAFIGEIPNKYEVNHINGDKTDNRVENLEIVTSSQNQKHAFTTGLQKPTIIGKSVSAFKSGILVGTYKTISGMCRSLSLNRASVWMVMSGKFTQHHGYTFKFNK